MKELELLRKLDEAVMALEAAGYVFLKHTVKDRHYCGTDVDFSRREIVLKCFKNLSGASCGEVEEIRRLEGFSSPLKHYRKHGRHLIPTRG